MPETNKNGVLYILNWFIAFCITIGIPVIGWLGILTIENNSLARILTNDVENLEEKVEQKSAELGLKIQILGQTLIPLEERLRQMETVYPASEGNIPLQNRHLIQENQRLLQGISEGMNAR